jgi:hypothetical protein
MFILPVLEMRGKIRTENVIWKLMTQTTSSCINQQVVKYTFIIPLDSILGLRSVFYHE